MHLQSRITVFVAIGGLLALMGGLFVYVDNTPSLQSAQIELYNVELLSSNTIDNSAELSVSFMVTNPSDTTFTVSSITYELYADDIQLGSSSYSTEDISMPGRAAFYPEAQIPLKSKILISADTENAQIIEKIIDGMDIEYTVTGILTLQTTWSTTDVKF
ncbi:MAG: putative membrane protein [Cenarchaeum symbiont of Oopsacas minuta]|nr:putative membrane protein [Cenarchaeum symbiont of Oopsacas minuta]